MDGAISSGNGFLFILACPFLKAERLFAADIACVSDVAGRIVDSQK